MGYFNVRGTRWSKIYFCRHTTIKKEDKQIPINRKSILLQIKIKRKPINRFSKTHYNMKRKKFLGDGINE